MPTPPRYRFADFLLCPRRRLLLRGDAPVPLIPRYFDLLVLLVVRRHEAVSKQAIFEAVWSDVVVSDGALSQAIRTLRRTLGDDSREPRFIRTVSRHGYQFVAADLREEADEVQATATAPAAALPSTTPVETTRLHAVSPQTDARLAIDLLVDRLLDADGDEAREIAERLHAIDSTGAVAALARRPNHARALALMRDARWAVAGAGPVPLIGDPEFAPSVVALVKLRLADVSRLVTRRWTAAALCGAMGGAAAGFAGGLALRLAPGSGARPGASIALGVIGLAAGAVGGAGVGSGLIAAEALARSRRGWALLCCGAAAGLASAALAQFAVRELLQALLGVRVHVGSPLDGLVLGLAAGGGYALATRQPPGGGLAAPTGWRRLRVAVLVGGCCAAGAALLATAGSPLVGGLVHAIARSSRDTQLGLEPLGRLIGEPGFGPITRTVLSAFEGAVFGAALSWGLTRRPPAH